MNRYDTYKPSGIEWIEEIPAHWEVKRIKNITQINYGDTLIEEDRIDGEVPVYGSNGITGVNDKPNTKAPCIIVGRKGSFGKVKFSDIECFAIDTTFYIDATASSQNLKWLYYVLDNIGLDKLSKDTGVPGLNREDAYRERLPFPPFPEQHTIASYLDELTHKIDKLITNKKAQVERLRELRQIEINNAVTKGLNPKVPMKDSGIEWLGEIPEHWGVKRLKNSVYINKDVLSESTNPDYIIQYIDISNVTSGGELIEIQEIPFGQAPSRARRKVKDKDIILSTVRTYLRAIAFIQKAEDNLIASTGFAVVSVNENLLNPQFLFFYAISHLFITGVISNSEGVSYPAISSTKLGDLSILIPPKDEQLQIANYLQQRTAAIDKLIKNTESQISKLQELRKIKIYEAVTGKLKIEN